MAAPALAGGDGLSVGQRIRFTNREGSTGGGEFGVFRTTGSANIGSELFRTFCLERNEYVDFHVAGFYVSNISDRAILGGLGGGPNDQLDDRTAWLYVQFRSGALAGLGYNYTPNSSARVTSANAFQNAIWKFESELTTNLAGLAATFYTAAQDAYDAGWRNNGRVAVLNTVWATDRGFGVGTNAQSMLVLIPLPGAAGLSTAGLVGLLAFRRRR